MKNTNSSFLPLPVSSSSFLFYNKKNTKLSEPTLFLKSQIHHLPPTLRWNTICVQFYLIWYSDVSTPLFDGPSNLSQQDC